MEGGGATLRNGAGAANVKVMCHYFIDGNKQKKLFSNNLKV